jgi:hypothetical protein
MHARIIGYRSLSKHEIEQHRARGEMISRRAVLSNLTSLPLAAAVCSIAGPSAAENSILAVVTFASAIIEFGERLYDAYSKVVTHPEVINHTNNVDNRALLGSVRNERGLLIHQGYTVIFVPPRSVAIVQVVVDAGSDPGMRGLTISSRIDQTSGEFEVA